MYGYVRPEKGELKVSEYERFRGVYCGLCHELRSRYGVLCRFLVNYDFTFLAMLLEKGETVSECARRCPYNLGAKRQCPRENESLADAADYTVILAYWKMRDSASDKGFWGAVKYKPLCALFKRHYKKAAAYKPDFAQITESCIRGLAELEAGCCASVDAAADSFARILQAAAEGEKNPNRKRALRELLYHLGRIVYILDAADDLAEDEKSGSYNPLRFRFSLLDGKLRPEDETALRESLQLSHNSISAAYELIEKNIYSGILANILYFGLPVITQAVFSGTWKASAKKKNGAAYERSL